MKERNDALQIAMEERQNETVLASESRWKNVIQSTIMVMWWEQKEKLKFCEKKIAHANATSDIVIGETQCGIGK